MRTPSLPRLVAKSASGIALILSICGACTFIYGGKSKDQCSTDQDCTSRGAAFTGTFCSDQKVCVSSTSFCNTNLECIQRNGGQPYICRQSENTCIALFDPNGDCAAILGADPPYEKSDLANDQAVIFGTLFTIAPGMRLPANQVPLGKSMQDGVQLAQQDFQSELLGLGMDANGQRRPLLFLACNDEVDPLRAATHLIDDVRVPALLGPLGGPDSDAISPQIVQKGVLDILPVATSIILAKRPAGQNLLFRLDAGDVPFMTTIAGLVPLYLEPAVRAAYNIPVTQPIKLAVIHADDPNWNGSATLLETQLTFNGGKTTTEEGQLVPPLFEDISYNANDMTAQGNAISQALQFAPHIALFVSSAETSNMMAQMDSSWTTMGYKPYYFQHVPTIGSDYTTILGGASADGGTANEDLRKRIIGLQPGPNPGDPIYGTFFQRFEGKFMSDKTTFPNVAAAFAMDAAYLLGLAATTVKGPITSQALATAIQTRTQPPGTEVDIASSGPTFLQNAAGILKSGANITYHGAAANDVFVNANVGDVYPRTQVWCINPSASAKPRILDTGLYLDETSLTLQGAINKTPCGF